MADTADIRQTREARPVVRKDARPTIADDAAAGNGHLPEWARSTPQPRRDVNGRVVGAIVAGETVEFKGAQADPFPTPRVEGWSFEWKSQAVMGKAQSSYETTLRVNGWRPVLYEDFPQFFGSIDNTGPVALNGLMCMRRPEFLTQESQRRQNDLTRSQTRGVTAQMFEKLSQSLDGQSVPDVLKPMVSSTITAAPPNPNRKPPMTVE